MIPLENFSLQILMLIASTPGSTKSALEYYHYYLKAENTINFIKSSNFFTDKILAFSHMIWFFYFPGFSSNLQISSECLVYFQNMNIIWCFSIPDIFRIFSRIFIKSSDFFIGAMVFCSQILWIFSFPEIFPVQGFSRYFRIFIKFFNSFCFLVYSAHEVGL